MSSNPESSLTCNEPKALLLAELVAFIDSYGKRHVRMFWMNVGLVMCGLLLSAAVTISGIFDQGILSAVFGVVLGTIFGIQYAFPIDEKAQFYRIVFEQAKNLRGDLQIEGEAVKKISDKFQRLRVHAARGIPKGQGMAAVKAIHEELDKI